VECRIKVVIRDFRNRNDPYRDVSFAGITLGNPESATSERLPVKRKIKRIRELKA
jgi:hypothetical protein